MTLTWFYFLILISTVSTEPYLSEQEETDPVRNCPHQCLCTSSIYESTKIFCNHAGIHEIPNNLPLNSEMINLENNFITTVPHTAFRGMKQLQILGLSSNNINLIKKGAFDDLDSLRELYLSRNNLSSLNKQIFKPSSELQYLYLANNKFTSIPEFDPMPTKLDQVDLSNNRLTNVSFPLTYRNLSFVFAVEMSNNTGIKRIHAGDFYSVREKLREINMENCGLNEIELGAFSHQSTLSTLSLSYNPGIAAILPHIWTDLSESPVSSLKLDGVFVREDLLPSTFSTFNWTTGGKLSLNNNIIGLLKSGTFESLSSLITLNLHNSSIRNIENKAFSGLIKLQYLDISWNKLSDIPLYLPSNIVMLDISNNKAITEIKSRRMRTLTNLNTIKMDSCSISTIYTDAFIGLNSVSLINLDHNKLTGNSLTNNSFQQVKLLKNIVMSHNPIGYIPDEAKAFQNIPHLAELVLSHSRIQNLPYNLFLNSTSNLKHLFLPGNNLCSSIQNDVEGTLFKRLQALEYLDLRDNMISHIPSKLFQGLHNLQILDLSQNYIRSWDIDVFSATKSLFQLRMDLNNITSVPLTQLEELGHLVMWNMTDNPFNCDCNLKPLRDWLSYTNITVYGSQDYTCRNPKNLQGYKLLELNSRNMTCSKLKPNMTKIKLIFIIISGGVVSLLLIGLFVLAIFKYREKYIRLSIGGDSDEDEETIYMLDDLSCHQNIPSPNQAFSISRIIANRYTK